MAIAKQSFPKFPTPSLFSRALHASPPNLSWEPVQEVMVLKIRLARFGKRNAPFYNIVVAQAR